MTQPAKFWDKHAEKYAASPIKDQDSYDYTLSRTASYLGLDDTVLEIGCGTGATALLLAEGAGQITGTDISPKMIEIANQRAREAGAENTTFEVKSAVQALQDAGGFNAVLGFNLFHLTEDFETLLAGLHDTLAPGALFISKTPCLAEPSIGFKRFLFRMLVPLMRAVGFAPFVRCFSFAELEEMITDAGFEIIETSSFPAMSRYIVARR